MLSSDLIRTALHGVTANISRSLLTMLGIIIGVASVVLMTGVGKSMEGVILGQISTLGARSMVIFPGSGGDPQHSTITAGYDSLTFSDVEALEKLTSITSVSPIIFISGEVRYGRETSSARISGVLPNYFQNQSIDAAEGRLLLDSDVRGAKNVAVIGPDVVKDLFPNGNALGKKITVGERSFTVIGVTESIGSQFFQNADENVHIPLSVARAVSGQKYVNMLTMQSTGNFDLAFAEVKDLLRRRHGIRNPSDDPDKDDFTVRSSAQASAIFGTVSLSLTAFITMIAGISLVVGGIGIMNIMLVAVTERTQEIGLRKAIGAHGRDILLQFLIEAVLLTVVGGIIGLLFGMLFAYIGATIVHVYLTSYSFALSPISMAVALFTAATIGLVFGIYPAKRASDLRPIEALRYE